MKRLLLVLWLGFPLTACLNVRPCTTNSECAPTGRCDVERQFCVFDPDAGVGGGAGGGGDGGLAPFCSVTCLVPLECRPSRSGGVCVPAYVLTFTQPTPGQAFDGPLTTLVEFGLSVRRTDGGLPGFTSIPFSIPGLSSPVPPTSLALSTPGSYRASVGLPPDTRSFTAVAGWDGGPLATVDFTVDRLPPVVTLDPALSADGGAHLRDAVVPVAIRSSKPLSATITLILAGTDGGVTAQSAPVAAGSCTAAGLTLGANDRCGLLDLSTPPLAGITGNLPVAVTAIDTGGNSGSSLASLRVTRLRWRVNVGATAATLVRAAPALDKEGNLLIGTEETPTTGRLVSLSPANGAVRFELSTGAVQSVAVSDSDTGASGLRETAYVSMVSGTTKGELRTYSTDGGTTGFSRATTCADALHPTYSAVALYDAGIGMNGTLAEVAAVLVFSPTSTSTPTEVGTLCSFGPRSGGFFAPGNLALKQPAPDGNQTLSAANLVVWGKRVFYQQVDRTLGLATVSPLAWGGSSGASAGGATTPTGLALGGNGLLGTSAGTGANPPLVSYSLSTPNSATFATGTGWGSAARGPVLLSGAVVAAGTGSGANWLLSEPANLAAPSWTGPLAAVAGPASGEGGSSVVVGTGPIVYAVRRDGSLFVYSASSTGVGGESPAWSGALFGPGAEVVAHPTLDCSRFAAGRPGTLYVVATDGRVAAVIVDSTKLSPNSPWPKWQRTAGNAGNPDFPLNPGCP